MGESRKPHKKIEDRMTELTNRINETGEKLPVIINNIDPYLRKLREEEKYAEYVLFGGQVIEFVVEELITVYEHAINYALLILEQGVGNTTKKLQVEAAKVNTNDGLGTLVSKLYQHYKLDEGSLITELDILVTKRNSVAHDLVKIYEGKMDRVNESIKPYAELQPIEKIFSSIINLQEEINRDLNKRKKWVSEKASQ